MASSVSAQFASMSSSLVASTDSAAFGSRKKVHGSSKQRHYQKLRLVAMASKKGSSVNILKQLEKKKLLSQVEKAGLLSKVESAGFSLSKIEKLGLLSKAEDLGLLSLAEDFASSSPSSLTSLALLSVIAAIGTVVLVPDDSSVLVVTQYVIAVGLGLIAGGLLLGSSLLRSLQEE